MTDLGNNWATVIVAGLAVLGAAVPGVLALLQGRKNHRLMNSRLSELLESRTNAARAEGVLSGAETEKQRVASLDKTVKGP